MSCTCTCFLSISDGILSGILLSNMRTRTPRGAKSGSTNFHIEVTDHSLKSGERDDDGELETDSMNGTQMHAPHTALLLQLFAKMHIRICPTIPRKRYQCVDQCCSELVPT